MALISKFFFSAKKYTEYKQKKLLHLTVVKITTYLNLYQKGEKKYIKMRLIK